jgi:hypothetical protein
MAVIVRNGTSSAGTSTLAGELQTLLTRRRRVLARHVGRCDGVDPKHAAIAVVIGR